MKRSFWPTPALISSLAAAVSLAACHDGTHFIGDDCVPGGAELPALLAARGAGAHVVLCRRAVFSLPSRLTLPEGLTLETSGNPTDPKDMATLRLSSGFAMQSGAAIASAGGGVRLRSLHFDGNRAELGTRQDLALVQLGPGQDYEVTHSVFANAPGWTHLHLFEPCHSALLADNLVTSAPRLHANESPLTDGFSISCADTIIERNHIVDASSTSVVYYGGAGTIIRDNVFRQRQTSAYSAVNLGDAVVADHAGVRVEGNQIISESPRYFHLGLAVGLHPWGKSAVIKGVTVKGNRLSGIMRWGVGVDGCGDCVVEDNAFEDWHPAPPLDGCPAPTPYVAAVAAGHAGGALQAGFSDGLLDKCLGEPDVLGPLYRTFAGKTPFPENLAGAVATFSGRLEQGQDAAALLRAEWDAVAARARLLCPAGATADLQDVWRRLADAQYGAGLSPAAADAQVKADLEAAPSGRPCLSTSP